jgi:hypothetical protein
MKKTYFTGTKIKEFKTREAFNTFLERNKHRYHMTEVFINNSFGIEYKLLLKL